MQSRWFPVVLVQDCDLVSAAALDLPFPLVAVAGKDPLEFRNASGQPVAAQTILRDAVARLAMSPEGAKAAADFEAAFAARFGAGSCPALCDLSAVPDAQRPAAALKALATGAVAGQGIALQRNRQLMRDLAELRIAHDQTQASFAALEGFFYDTVRSERRLFRELSPLRTQAPCLLAPGGVLEQRLPCDSTGLSDVAICLPKGFDVETGTLSVALELAESGAQIAEWQIEAADLQPGWLRLALDRALGPDAQTPQLRIRWQGADQLRLVTSVTHPDERFQPRPGAPLLAVQVWKYIPGTRVPAAAGSHMAHGADPVDRWLIGRSVMTAAVARADEGWWVGYSDQFAGLMVRPGPEDGSLARLEAALAAGVARLSGGVKTEQAEGPVVEYALAVAPVSARPRSSGSEPDFAPGHRTGWLALPPGKWAELQLFLPAPLSEPHDLYLMTRLAPGETAPATPPDACFFTLLAEVAHDR